MVVPPLPWRSIDSGGLLFTPQKVMRTRTDAQLQALQEAEAALPNGMRKVLAPLFFTLSGDQGGSLRLAPHILCEARLLLCGLRSECGAGNHEAQGCVVKIGWHS